jgi:hypothetical protein
MGTSTLQTIEKLGKDRHVVSIDCYSMWFDLVFSCVGKLDLVGSIMTDPMAKP